MKRILHMTPPEVSNGVYRYIFTHMPYIDQSEYQFCFLTKSVDELRMTPEYEKYHFPLYRITTVQREGREAFKKEMVSILNQGFDAIHLHTSLWRGFMIEEIAMEMGIPHVIVHSHSSGVDFYNPEERDEILQNHLKFKNMFSMEYATDICACSWVAADWLYSDKISRDVIKILPNPINVSRYKYNDAIRRNKRQELNADDKTIVGSIGRYCYTKNQEFLVKSFYEAHKKRPDLFLVLIGDGIGIDGVRKLIKELDLQDSVLCYGWRNDAEEFLMAMDAFCLPSRFEGFPISLIEAQTSGLKCIASDSVTRECNITGDVMYVPLEEQKWSEQLMSITNDYERVDKSALVSDAGYNVETSYKRLLELYQ